MISHADDIEPAEKVKALNPDKFQEFRLESKNVLSHNVSMYVVSR